MTKSSSSETPMLGRGARQFWNCWNKSLSQNTEDVLADKGSLWTSKINLFHLDWETDKAESIQAELYPDR